MLDSSVPIDAVFILSTHEYHAEQIVQCVKAGKHVLVEKPMAQTLDEADRVEKARVESGVVVFVGYMRRYARALDRLKEAIKGKEIKCEFGALPLDGAMWCG
jgi:predicted dehydrogenase